MGLLARRHPPMAARWRRDPAHRRRPDRRALASLLISLRVVRDGAEVVAGTVKVAGLHRGPAGLVAWLFRAMEFPVGVVLLTGTAIVPPPGFTLHAGDEVIIATTGLGELRNVVEVIAPPPAPAATRPARRLPA